MSVLPNVPGAGGRHRPIRAAASVAVPLLALALAACGGSGSTGSTATNAGGTPTNAGSTTTGGATTGTSGAKGPDACAIVTTALLQQASGTTFAAGQSKPSAIGGSECDFFATTGAGDGSVVVQVTSQPDLYFPKSNDASFNNLVALTAQADRGWVTKPDPGDTNSGHILVVKNGVGVDIAILVAKAVNVDGEQALAASIAGQL
ncbi:MAG TPA: hypothetical protein VH442_01180 [Micromonosporaceae bacterium]|jgi:hypothetical protein